MKHLLLLTIQSLVFIAIGYAIDNSIIFFTGIIILLLAMIVTFSRINLEGK